MSALSERRSNVRVYRQIYGLAIARRKGNKSEVIKVLGVVFTFGAQTREAKLIELVRERASREALRMGKDARTWAAYTSSAQVGFNDAEGVGFYVVQTVVDDAQPENTNVGRRR